MKLLARILWLAIVGLAAVYLVQRLEGGITLQSNILALLPRESRDNAAQDAQDRIMQALSHRIVFLVGDTAPDRAAGAARNFSAALGRSGLIASITSQADPAQMKRMGAAYFPYRAGLLSEADRAALTSGNGKRLVDRALSVLYGPTGMADGKLIARDPFLLMPSFFLALPAAQSRLSPQDGLPTTRDNGKTYVLVSGELAGDPYSLSVENAMEDFLSGETASLKASDPNVTLLRTGAVFYAHDGAKESMDETSAIGLVSLIGTLGLILLVFRGVRPIFMGLAAIGSGIVCAAAGTLWWFGQMHVIALLFGVSLIGISVDYSLQYFCEYFDTDAHDPDQRLKRVLPGIIVGVATTLIGYCTLLLAPFPGLRQVAVFSFIGLAATVATVLLWYPALDGKVAPARGTRLVSLAGLHWKLWEGRASLWLRFLLVGACIAAAAAGSLRFKFDDDVRHLQSLSPDLKYQEHEIARLTGATAGTQFLLVRGSSEQTVLATEEIAAGKLAQARRAGALSGFSAIAQYAPPVALQKSDRELVRSRLLDPYLKSYLQGIGFGGSVDAGLSAGYLAPADLPKDGPFSLLPTLDVSSPGQPAHIILLNGVTNPAMIQSLVSDLPGVRLVDLAEDWTRLFGDYRRYAIVLLLVSAALMYPLLAWRYGLGRGVRILAPSLVAVALAPLLAAWAGVAFTFFNAMALVLVLSIGVDYAVFCSESSGTRKPVTALAIALAALSTILSFGLLAFSRVFAVHAFGTTMLIGICLAFLFAPAAGDGAARLEREVSS
jgi:predicted exporter